MKLSNTIPCIAACMAFIPPAFAAAYGNAPAPEKNTAAAPTTAPSAATAASVSAAAPAPAATTAATTVPTSYKFSFGAGEKQTAGTTKVTADMVYDDARGYGFEASNPVKIASGNDKSGNTPSGVVTGDKQFFFSMKLPQGNYKFTVTFGNPDVPTTNFVKAELHRLMLENVSTKPGEYVTKTFIVNEHQPQFDGGKVALKGARETNDESWSWDDRITLEFSGTQPSVANIAVEKVDVPTIYIIGDSTSCDQMADPYSSWGGMVTNFFKPEVAVCNFGESGETLADGLHDRRFDKAWSQMKPGDYLFVQYGHNDMKEKPSANNPVPLDTFKTDLHRVATETKAHGGTLILVTPVSRADPKSGFAGFVEAMKAVDADEKVPLIDLNATSKTLYTAFGDETVYHKLLFAYDSKGALDPTHHNRFGSYEIAKTVLADVQQDKLDLAKYIVDGFSFDPAKPDKVSDFKVPASTNIATDKPPGS